MAKREASWWVGGLACGVAGMYLLDPRSGRSRRAKARAKLERELRLSGRAARHTALDVSHRARGLIARLRRAVGAPRHDGDPDVVIERRVRSALGRVCSHPSLIDVFCEDGAVELQGYVVAAEARRVRRTVARVSGVHDVTDKLEVLAEGERDRVGGLAAGQPDPAVDRSLRPSRRANRRAGLDVRQHHWAPSTRAFVGAIGTWLVGRATRRRGWAGAALATTGAAMLSRAVTNHELPELVGAKKTSRGVVVHQTVDVAAPVDRVWGLWTRLESFPRFMVHVREVRRLSGGRYLWEVTGPAGTSVSWRAEVTHVEPTRTIAWRTVGGRPAHQGVVRFREAPNGHTQIDVRLAYQPPAGYLGHQVARWLGADPGRQVREDLQRLKALVETGRAAGSTDTLEALLETPDQGPPGLAWLTPNDEIH